MFGGSKSLWIDNNIVITSFFQKKWIMTLVNVYFSKQKFRFYNRIYSVKLQANGFPSSSQFIPHGFFIFYLIFFFCSTRSIRHVNTYVHSPLCSVFWYRLSGMNVRRILWNFYHHETPTTSQFSIFN